MNEISIESKTVSLKSRTEEHTGEFISKCYQCGKCAAGCPLSEEMDLKPNQILRLMQQEYPDYEDEILSSYGIWLCLTCQTCTARCPQEVDIALITDYLRSESLNQGKIHPKARDILSFHQAFLSSVESGGRLSEVGLIKNYKLKTMHLMQDVALAPQMFAKGKLHLFPKKAKGLDGIKEIFQKTRSGGEL